ncbi:MAG: hypothetical protein J2O44_00660 [Porphyrobacter sp.]|nr:hypothetical protein [Porphyrobacter sp.]
MKAALGLAAFAALAACAAATPPPDRPPARPLPMPCKKEPGQRFVGMKATGDLGRELLAATGARVLRWVPPRTAVTMDFRGDRLTVSYDDDYVITRVSCG